MKIIFERTDENSRIFVLQFMDEKNKSAKAFWNDRYKAAGSAYGEEPNAYFSSQLIKYKPGKILLPAEGAGRNAVFAAKLGWQVYASDLSMEGMRKAKMLAKKHAVTINYKVGEFSDISYKKEHFDCIGLIYAHFPAEVKSAYHKMLDTYLKEGGLIIFEAFSKNHLRYLSADPKAGGPRDIQMLYSVDEIRRDFGAYRHLELTEKEVILDEGLYHQGRSCVIRFTGQKKIQTPDYGDKHA